MVFSQKYIYIVFILILSIGIWFFYGRWIGIDSKNTIVSFSGEVFQSKKIEEAKKLIQGKYYHFSEKKKDEIEDGMIRALVGSLWDKHSDYFPPKEAKEFDEMLRGDFEGIGAVIDATDRGIVLRKIFPSSPAEKSGLVPWDIVTHVWDENIVWLSTEDAVKRLRWPKSSKVMITYLHGEKYETKKTEVIRDTILIPSTAEMMLSGSIWYIEVAFFWEHTEEEFRDSLDRLSASWATSLILDFRNNGGGYLESSVWLLSFFLDAGKTAVITRENDPDKTERYTTKERKSLMKNVPIVMIINNLSASATEIVAWALQDYDRAVILWEKSYGKGSVQEPFVLSDGSVLKITTGRWYTPQDRSIDKLAITPDIIVPLQEKDILERYDRQLEWAKIIIEKMIAGETVPSIKKAQEELPLKK